MPPFMGAIYSSIKHGVWLIVGFLTGIGGNFKIFSSNFPAFFLKPTEILFIYLRNTVFQVFTTSNTVSRKNATDENLRLACLLPAVSENSACGEGVQRVLRCAKNLVYGR